MQQCYRRQIDFAVIESRSVLPPFDKSDAEETASATYRQHSTWRSPPSTRPPRPGSRRGTLGSCRDRRGRVRIPGCSAPPTRCRSPSPAGTFESCIELNSKGRWARGRRVRRKMSTFSKYYRPCRSGKSRSPRSRWCGRGDASLSFRRWWSSPSPSPWPLASTVSSRWAVLLESTGGIAFITRYIAGNAVTFYVPLKVSSTSRNVKKPWGHRDS